MLDAMAQVGSELIVSPSFDPRLQGGFQVAVAPSDAIRFFMETSVYMKDLSGIVEMPLPLIHWHLASSSLTLKAKQQRIRSAVAMCLITTSTGVNTMARSPVISTGIDN